MSSNAFIEDLKKVIREPSPHQREVMLNTWLNDWVAVYNSKQSVSMHMMFDQSPELAKYLLEVGRHEFGRAIAKEGVIDVSLDQHPEACFDALRYQAFVIRNKKPNTDEEIQKKMIEKSKRLSDAFYRFRDDHGKKEFSHIDDYFKGLKR